MHDHQVAMISLKLFTVCVFLIADMKTLEKQGLLNDASVTKKGREWFYLLKRVIVWYITINSFNMIRL